MFTLYGCERLYTSSLFIFSLGFFIFFSIQEIHYRTILTGLSRLFLVISHQFNTSVYTKTFTGTVFLSCCWGITVLIRRGIPSPFNQIKPQNVFVD